MASSEAHLQQRTRILIGAAIVFLCTTYALVRPNIWHVDWAKPVELSSCHAIWERKLYRHARLLERRRATVRDEGFRFAQRTSFDPFEPTYTCHSEYRRGEPFGDGGKFVCGEDSYFTSKEQERERCLVYSIGSSGETSFEADVIMRLGCEVHTFDPTGNTTEYKAVVEATGATFHAIGASGSRTTIKNSVAGVDAPLLPIADIIDLLGHGNRHISVLKIDCEGCEYEAFEALWPRIREGRTSIGQIQVELHNDIKTKGIDFGQINRFFEGANDAGYMLFHKERNHWGCDGYLCVEFSLIHRDEARRIYEHTHC